MQWFTLTLIFIIFQAIYIICSKYFMEKHLKDTNMIMMLAGAFNVLYFVVIFIILRFNVQLTFLSGISMIAGAFLSWYMLAYFRVIEKEEISILTSLLYTVSLFVAVLAYFFLNEVFGTEIYFSIVLIVLGVGLLSYQKARSGITKFAAILIALMIFLATIALVLSKYALTYMNYWEFFAYNAIGYTFGVSILWLKKNLRQQFFKFYKNKRFLAYVLFLENFGLLAALIYYYAIKTGTITLVSSVALTVPLLVFVFATTLSKFKPHIMEEDITRGPLLIKFVATILIIIGIYVIGTY